MTDRIISVFLVDDEKIIRDGMKKIFDWDANGFRICGESSNGRDALPLILSVKPDIVITDLKMPFMDGITLSNEITKQCSASEIVVVTGFDEFEYARDAIRAGVFDFLVKPVSPIKLGETVLRLKEKILNRSVKYPFELEKALSESITKDDSGGAIETLSKIFCYLSENRASQEIVISICKKLLKEVETAYTEIKGSKLFTIRPELSVHATIAETEKIIQRYLVSIFDTNTSDSPDLIVGKIKRFLEENYSENISLETLGDEFYLNTSYISRIFKIKTGENYSNYLLNIRIDKAKHLLANTNRPIQKICEIAGFNNSKYFSRIFKEITHLTPTEYRKSNRSNKHE